MFLSLLYEVALILIALTSLPKMLYMLLVHGKYWSSFSSRLGKGFPAINKGGRKLIWIHAVSVGETKAIASLVKQLKQGKENPIILISNITETGHAEAKRVIPNADYHVYLPFDFGWLIRPIVRKAAPDWVILSESDFWYNFLKAAKNEGARVALVNGKISEKSKCRFCKAPLFSKALFSLIDLFCVQNRHYKERFAQLGVPENKLIVTGNMKFDDEYPQLTLEQLTGWKQQLGIKETDLVIVFGSSHDPEEKMIISILNKLSTQFSNLKLVLVPRHPERFNEVAEWLQKTNVLFQRFTRINGCSKDVPVILIDAMGLLRKCYQLANVAVVGGSYTHKVGGHNILEPCWYGVPVLYGPYMHSQPELVELMEEYQAGFQVNEGKLQASLEKFLNDPNERKVIGVAGRKLVAEMHGATQRTLQHIEKIVCKI